MIEFGEWLPDIPALNNPGLVKATGVIPLTRGYTKFPGQQVFSDALTARARGAISARDNTGTAYNYAGDATKLYELAASAVAWTDVSQTSTTYTTATDEIWQFARWEDQIFATNFNDNPQEITFGDAEFADLTSDFKARYIAVVADFVVFGNTNDSTDDEQPYRVRWSAINDPTDYTVSASTLSDFQDLRSSGGWVRGIAGGTYGVVFQEQSLWRMTFVGSPTVFRFDEIAPNVGTVAPQSIVQLGNLVFFLAQDGFRTVTNGATTELIGAGKVDRFFANDVNFGNIHRVSGAVDPEAKRVFWAYPSNASADGTPDKIMCYDITTNRWSLSEQETQLLWVSLTGGFTLDALDNVSSSIDDLEASLDSRTWTAENRVISAFNADNKMSKLTGSSQAAVLETGEFQITQGRRTNLRRVRPHINRGPSGITVRARYRDRLTDNVQETTEQSLTAEGDAPVRKNARYHSLSVSIPSGSDFEAVGYDFEAGVGAGR